MYATGERGPLRIGDVYRDLDGSLIQLLQVIDNICCWVPVTKGWNDREYIQIDYFCTRFRRVSDQSAAARAV